MPTDSLTINEITQAFLSLKINKSPGCDEISFNVIRDCFSELNKPVKYLFHMSLESENFPDKLKIARVIPLFKAGDPASPSLSKIYEWFNANKLSLNADKTMHSLFHKTDDLPLLLPKFLINDNKVERVESTKFLGVLLHEHISYMKNHPTLKA